MSVLTSDPLNTQLAIDAVSAPSAGAVLTFTGAVRDHRGTRPVTGIDYHAYENMAVKEMDRIEEEAEIDWPGVHIRILHRIGPLVVGEASVVIAVSAPHRSEGFEALRFAIEEIKKRVPIWKKEQYPDGHAWIEGS